MKKSTLAIMLAATFASAAHAEIALKPTADTTARIYGIVDLYAEGYETGVNHHAFLMNPGGLSQNQFGLNFSKTVPDGLTVGATLEIHAGPDNGNGKSSSAGTSNVVFGKRSSIDISGDFGTVNLGRLGTPFFSVIAYYDGLAWGSAIGPFLYNAPNITTASNAVVYTTPKMLGALTWKIMYVLGETTGANDAYRANTQVITSLVYDKGPLHFHGAFWRQNLTNTVMATPSVSGANVSVPGYVNLTSFGASYDFGRFRPWATVQTAKDSTKDGTPELSYGSNTVTTNTLGANQLAWEFGLRTIINPKLYLVTMHGGMHDKERAGLGGHETTVRLEYKYDPQISFWVGTQHLINASHSYFQDFGASPTMAISPAIAGYQGSSAYTTSALYAGKPITSIASGVRFRF